MKYFIFIFLLLINTSALAITITLEDVLQEPKTLTFTQGARINDALENQAISESSFFLGAGWYKKSLLHEQKKLRTGILFNLQLLINIQKLAGNTHIVSQATVLYHFINTLKPNGRTIQTLDPAALLVTDINHLLDDGDHITFRPRPQFISVIGAVNNTCLLDFTALQTAADYLSLCPSSKVAEPSFVYLIQANGEIFKQGIAPFNRRIKQTIAPGAILFIPFKSKFIRDIDPNLHNEIAAFLATQTPLKATLP